MPRAIPVPIVEDFNAGILLLRGGEVWRVKRRYRGRIMNAHPARRIDRPTNIGGARITVRRGKRIFTATLKALIQAGV